ncbi:recombinase family protein [uncultured Bradyrhizobium sp.]|uniref:recombinase family protein n=1 Tax=Bradyrhizobium sp. TaxID=376 RepID=UPI00261E9964|nr:recombinase family protein [uncultured Bradyrhizobium sp.]
MTNALTIRKDHLPRGELERRAAQYVRMSTEKQVYSIANQMTLIAAYASAHHLAIVETYADEGKSGLQIKNRPGLQRLIRDVTTGAADYGQLLVYDVSRWGRFQDLDESAHYEFLCRDAGVKVEYCAEEFKNDFSTASTLGKYIKRTLAADFSRDLSARVHACHSRVIRQGFSVGAPRTYGLRRELVDQKQRPRQILEKGEVKFLQSDRVRIRQGPPHEVAIVKWIFAQCLKGKTDEWIARELNRREVASSTGHPWNSALVYRVLKNEAFIGNLVYNRMSRKLKGPRVFNPPDQWIRVEGCIDPIISTSIFERVQKLLASRRVEISETEMLARLRKTLRKRGRLTTGIINSTVGLPCFHTYIRHFGSIREAFRLIGYTSERDHTYIDAKESWAEEIATLCREIGAHLKKLGRKAKASEDQLFIGKEVLLNFRVARAYRYPGCLNQYRIPFIRKVVGRWVVVIRLTDDAKSVLDYVLIPKTGLVKPDTRDGVRFTDAARDRLGFDIFNSPHALSMGIHRKLSRGRTKASKVA